jgi:hypothetical protein
LNYESDCSDETGGVIDFLLNLLNACIDTAEIRFVVFEMLFDLCDKNIELSFYPTQGSLDIIVSHFTYLPRALAVLRRVLGCDTTSSAIIGWGLN